MSCGQDDQIISCHSGRMLRLAAVTATEARVARRLCVESQERMWCAAPPADMPPPDTSLAPAAACGSKVRQCRLKPVEARVDIAWCQRLKPNCDELVSSIAFKFNFHRHSKVADHWPGAAVAPQAASKGPKAAPVTEEEAGAYTRPLPSST
jgi:hypothetical protein